MKRESEDFLHEFYLLSRGICVNGTSLEYGNYDEVRDSAKSN